MKPVLFTSNRKLGRAENITALWNAYEGPKDFHQGVDRACKIATARYGAVITDEIPGPMRRQGKPPTIYIGHGLTGGKVHGVQTPFWRDRCKMIVYGICSSTKATGIMAMQLGMPEDRIVPLGMPRTDAYLALSRPQEPFGNVERMYLYAPTYRTEANPPLPEIDWAKLDEMMMPGEVLVVKRHMNTGEPLLGGERYAHIAEVGSGEVSTPYLVDCDVLLTDFSSILFDGYVLGKPAVLVTDGAEAYMKSRGMYQEYPEEYGSSWTEAQGNEEELYAMMSRRFEMSDGEREVRDKVADMCDGHSCERVVEFVKSLM